MSASMTPITDYNRMVRCPICGAETGQPCTVVSGGYSPNPELDGLLAGERRPIPHFYRTHDKTIRDIFPDDPVQGP